MALISPELLQFLQLPATQRCIAQQDFSQLYKRAELHNPRVVPQELTKILYDAGIDPLVGVKGLPHHFLAWSDLESFKIPEGITQIGAYAFRGCRKLEVVYIPSTITFIDTGSFWNTGSLNTVYYNGTKAQWKNLVGTRRDQIFDGSSPDITVYCLDGEVKL